MCIEYILCRIYAYKKTHPLTHTHTYMVIRVCKGREQVSDANMLVIVAGLFLTISTSFCRIGFDMFQQIKSNKLSG